MKKAFANRLILLFITIVILMVLFACAKEDTIVIPDDSVRIYRADATTSELSWEYFVIDENIGLESQIVHVFALLKTAPENAQYKQVVPDYLTINYFLFGEDGQLILDFSEEYSKMDRISEILCRAGIVKSMCELEGVDSVEFTVMGQPLMLKSDTAAGIMTAGDFIDNTGEQVMFRQTVNITVYFADLSGTMLTESRLIVESNGTKTQEELAIDQLINGPLEDQLDMLPVLPEGTSVNKISTRDGICYVDFNDAFLNNTSDITDEIVVYSVVNTLAEITSVSKVQITINGETVKSYGDIALNVFLERRPDLMLTEKAGDVTE